MSLEAQKLVMLIKQAAVDAVNASDPMSLKVGEVVSVSPLKISINQKITVAAQQLLLTNAVRNCCVYATIDGTRKKIVMDFGLNLGEKVLMLRCDGGQKFIVLDRLETANG